MTRTTALATLALAIAQAMSGSQAVADERNSIAEEKDVSDIYLKFLDGWTDNHKSTINVSETTDTLSPEDIKQIAECAGGNSSWVSATTQSDIGHYIGKPPYVRLVDPHKWVPRDPEKLIAKGTTVDEAVTMGFSHGLLSVSSIQFDTLRQIAGFKYSFGCGALCGGGGVILFEKTSGGWAQSKKQCDGWIS